MPQIFTFATREPTAFESEFDTSRRGGTPKDCQAADYNAASQAFFEYDNHNYHFHMAAGQRWSLLTRDPVGLLPNSENVPLTIDPQHVEATAAPEFRFVEDWNKIGSSVYRLRTLRLPSRRTAPVPRQLQLDRWGSPTITGMPTSVGLAVSPGNTCNDSRLLDNETLCSNNVRRHHREIRPRSRLGSLRSRRLEHFFADVATTARFEGAVGSEPAALVFLI